MLVVGDLLIKEVKRKLRNEPSVIVCDSARKMMLNHLGIRNIIIQM